jgi:UTP--glucose-1-phosphate uridylyltransferase
MEEMTKSYPRVRKAIIPAAGLGTRFLPATKALPKEMIPIVDKPAIQYIVEEALASGIEEILIIIGRDKAAIEDHFDRSVEMEHQLEENGKSELLKLVQDISAMADIHYVRQKSPLGLGHAIHKGELFAAGEPVAVLLPDEIMDSDVPCLKQLIDKYEEYGCSILGVREVADDDVSKYGIVDGIPIDDGEWTEDGKNKTYKVRNLIEKPKKESAPSNIAIIGRYIITPEIFEILGHEVVGAAGEIQLTDGLKTLSEQQGMIAYVFEGNRYDSGDKFGFLQATVELALKRPDVGPEFRAYLEILLSKK